MDQVNLLKTDFKTFEGVWSAKNRPYPYKFFKGRLSEILLGPFFNTLSHIHACLWYCFKKTKKVDELNWIDLNFFISFLKDI